jgi:hypothetical protein
MHYRAKRELHGLGRKAASVVKEIVLMEFRRQPDLFERGLQAASSRDNRPCSRTHYEAVIENQRRIDD